MIKAKVTGVSGLGSDLLCHVIGSWKHCVIDPYTGLGLDFEKYPPKSLIGKVLELPDDCYYIPTYLPNEGEIKLFEGEK